MGVGKVTSEGETIFRAFCSLFFAVESEVRPSHGALHECLCEYLLYEDT